MVNKMNETIVLLDHISKSFPGVKALDNVHFELRSGEVMALLGENGAGKSTLMKILSGVYTRDEGTMQIFGKECGNLTPKQAQEMGVAIIHQELNMCRHLSIAENMFLGREKRKGIILSDQEMEREAKAVLDELKIDLDPKQVVGDLPVSKQQMVEIAKALSFQAKVLIMDEPTSALTSKEIDDLFRIIKDLRSKGCGIVYISHRLEELQHIVDRVTIMRDGQYITAMNFKDATMNEIIAHMVGREIKEKFPHVECKKGKKIFEVKNLNAGRMVRDINFSLYEGEIVGFAGLVGAGRSEVMKCILGLTKNYKGEVEIEGSKVHIHNPIEAMKYGLALVPEDRKLEGLYKVQSVRYNSTIEVLGDFIKGIFVDGAKEEAITQKYIDMLSTKTPTQEQLIGNLSGGNQQKVIIGRWLATNPKILILDEPTRGVDVGAKSEIYAIMNELVKQGMSIIMISSELPEIINMSDRIYVMSEGNITGCLSRDEVSQEAIMKLAAN